MKGFTLISLILLNLICIAGVAQNQYELNTGWKCSQLLKVKDGGTAISDPSYPISNWQPAVVPGTVLTTQLENKQIPDPFYGMNNEKIPDIYKTGRDYYTYWFVRDFKETIQPGEQVWIHLRGVNYSCDVFLNGQKLNPKRHYGMFLRQSYNVTRFIKKMGQIASQ